MSTSKGIQRAPHKKVERVASLGILILMWGIVFGPALTGQYTFGFRDTAHFYYPLFQWMEEARDRGESGFWSPLDDFGRSMAGDASSGVFYPARLVFDLPWGNFTTRFNWFVSLHLLLAAFGARFAARVTGCTPLVSSMGGIGYAFGGIVLFQTCNLIYLIGASWLPWAIASWWRFQHGDGSGYSWLAATGATIAMMVLGGDPQMALLTALAMGVTFPFAKTGRSIPARIGGLTAAIVLAAVFSAPQIAASASALAKSDRTDKDTFLPFAGTESPWAEPVSGSHAAAIYEFSFAPWRVVEVLVPWASGRFDFVRETVWSSRLPGADRIWTPSIYSGLVLVLGMILQWKFRARESPATVPDRALWTMVFFFLIGSFGWYGPVWLVHELNLMRGGGGLGGSVGKPVGGLYWLLVNVVPGFSWFRYPSKLLTVAALAACVLGARGLQQWLDEGQDRETVRRRARSFLIRVSCVSLAGASLLTISKWTTLIDGQIEREASASLLHTGLVSAALLGIAMIGRKSRDWRTRWKTLVPICLAVDVLIANASMSALIHVHEEGADSAGPARSIFQSPGLDDQLAAIPDHASLAGVHGAWQRAAMPGWHRQAGMRLAGTPSSIASSSFRTWMNEVARLGSADRAAVLAACSVESSREAGMWTQPGNQKLQIEFRESQIAALPHVRLAHQWQVLSPIDESSPDEIAARTRDVIGRQIRGGAGQVVIESNDAPAAPSQSELSGSAEIRTIEHRNERMVFEVQVRQPSLLVVADSLDENWFAWTSGSNSELKEVPIFRANRVLSAIAVGRETRRVILDYRPPGAGAPLWISIGGWVATAFLAWAGIGRRAGKAVPPSPPTLVQIARQDGLPSPSADRAITNSASPEA